MKWFDDLFTPPASPDREIEPHEHVLNQIRSLDGERSDARARLFMNQMNDAEAGNIGNVIPEQGAIGSEIDPPPPQASAPPPPPASPLPARQDPTNVNIANEYNSFNLANVTPPIAPQMENEWDSLGWFLQVQMFLPAYIWWTHVSYYFRQGQNKHVVDLGKTRWWRYLRKCQPPASSEVWCRLCV